VDDLGDKIVDLTEGVVDMECIEADLILHEEWMVVGVQDNEGAEVRADGPLDVSLQEHSGDGEIDRSRHACSWEKERSAASGSGNETHVPLYRSAEEVGCMEKGGVVLLPPWVIWSLSHRRGAGMLKVWLKFLARPI